MLESEDAGTGNDDERGPALGADHSALYVEACLARAFEDCDEARRQRNGDPDDEEHAPPD